MVIFDLDGTLLNTLDDLADAGNYALAEQGYPVHEVDKYKYFVGNGIPKLIERILPDNSDEKTKRYTYELFCSYYDNHMNDKTKPYNGIVETLGLLKRNSIFTVVVTNKANDFAHEIIKKYFGNLIDSTYGSIEGFPVKPDTFWVNKALSDFGIDKENVIYVGDSGVDMLTAKASGLFACGVTWGFRKAEELQEKDADVICNNYNELLDIIHKKFLC